MTFSSRTQICSVMCLLGYSKHFTLPCPLQELCPHLHQCRAVEHTALLGPLIPGTIKLTSGQQVQVWAFSSKPLFILACFSCLFLLSRTSFSYCPLFLDSWFQNMRGGSGQQWIWDHLPISSIFFSCTCRNSRCVWVRYLQQCWSGLQNLVADLITVPYSTKYTDESCKNAER